MSGIEYFYGAASAFAYLGASRLTAIAAAAGQKIIHRPVFLKEVVSAVYPNGFIGRTPAHRSYYFSREIERWSEQRGVAIGPDFPANHANDSTLANLILIACAQQELDINALALAMMQAHWRDHSDLGDEATLHKITQSVGIDANALIADAKLPGVKAQFEANTAEAIERSVFGSPTYFVDGDMFYGQDRLEMVERALNKPYAKYWP